jgi:hypothetical protein
MILGTPMAKPQLTQKRVILAFGIAIMADLIQIPVTAVTMTGIFAIPGEIADLMVDCVVMVATSLLLGFHWLLLPTLFVEVIPGLDLLPTWTGCVALLVKKRREEQALPPEQPVMDVQEVEVVSTEYAEGIPAQMPPPLNADIDERLNYLNDLLERNVISQEEYDAKRQQILAGI